MNPFAMTLGLGALLLMASLMAAQEPKKKDPKGDPGAGKAHPLVDQSKVDAAIRKGVDYLKTAGSPGDYKGTPWEIRNCDELLLLTLIHAGVPSSDPKVQELLKRVLESELERTYSVSLAAMCLEEIDRVRYQPRIRACAQFLVDNQCGNGQWSYGEPTPFAAELPTKGLRKDVASGPAAADSAEPSKPSTRWPVKRMRTGPATGDNSNSQYAALGIRACHDAGIVFPKEVVALARFWWESSQGSNGAAPNGAPAVATGGGARLGEPRGWSYRRDPGAYGSMSAGAVASVVIYDYVLGKDWKKDRCAQDGLAWLSANWSVVENPRVLQAGNASANTWLYYFLYAIERAGMLYDTPGIGSHDWYLEGARVLLEAQRPDGSWEGSNPRQPSWDTCFAILFLRRATRRLQDVPSVDRVLKAPK